MLSYRLKVVINIIVAAMLLVALVVAIPGTSFSYPGSSLDWMKNHLQDSLNQFMEDINNSKKAISSRDLSAAALATLLFQKDPALAESLMQKLFEVQVMDKKSLDYGKIPWRFRGSKVSDDNSIEFCMLSAAPAYIRYRGQLSQDFLTQSIPHLKAAIVAIKNHKVPVYYTNIYLMKSVNLILLGQIIGDKAAIFLGAAQIKEWLSFTRKNGITEYDSPQYYGVDLYGLSAGYLFAENREDKANIKLVMDYIWTDIAANFFLGRESLSGPHSRDYDFLSGTGIVDYWNYALGLRKSLPEYNIGMDLVLILINEENDGYRLSQKLISLAHQREKVVLQRWGSQPGQDRYNYITSDFTIGSVSRDYCSYDKNLVIQLASAKNLPDISIVLDDTDQPYGVNKIRNADGHSKPQHLSLRPVSVQDKGKLLVLLDVKPDRKRLSTTFATNILLPLHADHFLINGKQIKLFGVGEVDVPRGAVVTVQEGVVEVSLRVFYAQDCYGNEPRIVLKADKWGAKYGAARVVIYHHSDRDLDTPDSCASRVGLLFNVEDVPGSVNNSHAAGEELQFAHVRDEYRNNVWTVNVQWGGVLLEASRDLKKKDIIYRRVNGQPQVYDALTVNSVPLFDSNK